MPDIRELLDDLDAESAEVDALVTGLDEAGWKRETPSIGWTIAHQIAHLNWTDTVALSAVTDPDAFNAALLAAVEDPNGFVDRAAQESLLPPAGQLSAWRAGRAALREALAQAPPDRRLPWYGVTMSPASMATARIMETWAHGVDIADALGVERQPTARLRHIAFLAIRTFGFSFAAHGRPIPAAPVRAELTAPDGSLWTFGSPGAANVVRGPALDFCLLATQRRHRDDLALKTVGPIADEWLDVAQAFAGPPGAGRAPLAGRRSAPAETPEGGS